MLIRNAAECEALIPVGENNRIVFRECMQTVAGGSYYNYESSVLHLLSASWLVLVGAVLIIAVVFIVQILGNENLTSRQKWGYPLGVICAPLVFIPLYLILVPASDQQASDPDSVWENAFGNKQTSAKQTAPPPQETSGQ